MAKLFHALMKERKSFISVHLKSALTSLDREHFDPLTKIVSYSIIYGLMVKYCGVRLVHCKIKKLTNLKNVNINYKTTKL